MPAASARITRTSKAAARAAGRICALWLLVIAAACALSITGNAAIGGARPIVTAPMLVHRTAVFGSDDRVRISSVHRALGAKIGVIYDSRAHTVCSAFCVAENVVATAAHCLYGVSGDRPHRLSDFSFRLNPKTAGRSSRIAGAVVGAGAQNVLAGSMQLSVRPPIDATRDWALVRLAGPACRAGSLKLRSVDLDDLVGQAEAGRVYQIAYHRDFGSWTLALGRACPIRRDFDTARWADIARDFAEPERLILHTCDTGGASSGSPLFIDGPDGPEVVGMNVGTYVLSKVMLRDGEVIQRLRAENVANTAVSARAFSTALQAFAGADILIQRNELRRLQTLLGDRGDYRGKHDGLYGPDLRHAIESYQRRAGLSVTGLATRDLLVRLETANETLDTGQSQPTSASAPKP